MWKKIISWLMEQRKNTKLLILDLIIGGLAVFLVIMAFSALDEMSYYHEAYEEDSFYYRMQDESYAQMVSMYYSNVAAGEAEAEELQEYYGIAKYFEAAAHYKMYEEAGEAELAWTEAEKMEAAYTQMGDLALVKEKIDAQLGIE